MKTSIIFVIKVAFFIWLIGAPYCLEAQQMESIDQFAANVLERYGIPGMAIGVIDKGQVIHRAYYGTYDMEKNSPVDQHSLFNLHSLSKVFVNVAVFKFIEEGKLSLEDELTEYIKDYPPHWEAVKVKHLLSHSSGIPNIIRFFGETEAATMENLYDASPIFQPGSSFDYNQSNYWLLNRIISQLTQERFDNDIRMQIKGSEEAPLLFDSELNESNLQPKEYRPGPNNTLEMEYSEVQDYMNGAGGINISLDDFINWNLLLDEHKLISADTKNKMWSPFVYGQEHHQFAHGWGIYPSNGTKSVGFSGGGVAGLRKFNQEDLSIIVLTNGYQYRFDVNTIINWIADQVREDLTDVPSVLQDQLYKIFLDENEDQAETNFNKLISQNSQVNMDPILNSLGYELLAKNLTKQAMTVFELNTKMHPRSWNTWDSFAEGYEHIGNHRLAIRYYKKSLSLNPENEHAIEQLKELSK